MTLYLSPAPLGFNLELLEVSLFKMDQKLGIPIHVPTRAISGHLPCCPFATGHWLWTAGSLAKGPAAGGNPARWLPLLWAVPQAQHSLNMWNRLYLVTWMKETEGIYERMVWHNFLIFLILLHDIACIWNQWTSCPFQMVNKHQGNRREKDSS